MDSELYSVTIRYKAYPNPSFKEQAEGCKDNIEKHYKHKNHFMKTNTLLKALAIIACVFSFSNRADAQFYEIANRIPSLISPALSGSFNYKGYVEAGYSKAIGNYDADFAEISTSQGFKYANWFYMGVGLGVDVLFAHQNENWGNWQPGNSFDFNHGSRTTAVMMPLFTDFRFNFGKSTSATFFADLKLGCSFLLSNKYIAIGDGYLTNQEYFYLRPTIGIRIPTNINNSKQAVSIGLNYKLLTSNYWSNWSRNITLNSFGASLSYEW